MKKIIQSNQQYVLRLDFGDEFIEELSKFCSENNIKAAAFTAIGATKELTLAFYNIENKKYEDSIFKKDMEIINITGNISALDGKIIIHAHGTFAGKNLNAIGGHIKRAVVSMTCEIFLTVFDGTMKRTFNEKTGLNLLDSSTTT